MAHKDPYPLTRGKLQLSRVNMLQMLWRDTNGYLLHPETIAGGKGLKIADVATATGLWLCAVDLEAPGKHELRGFDISSDTFIASEQLPKNVELRTVDASKPPPAELEGQFDIVHVRLLQSVIFNNDPEWVISHCLKLLRPGGFLHWEEFDPMALQLHKHDGKAENLQKLVDILQTRVQGQWVEDLPNRMKKLGMEVKSVERKRQAAFHNNAMTYLHCLVFEEFANTFLDSKGPPGSGEEMRKLAQDGFSEALDGSYTAFMFQTVVAQKQ